MTLSQRIKKIIEEDGLKHYVGLDFAHIGVSLELWQSLHDEAARLEKEKAFLREIVQGAAEWVHITGGIRTEEEFEAMERLEKTWLPSLRSFMLQLEQEQEEARKEAEDED